jgi:hypothetical protein
MRAFITAAAAGAAAVAITFGAIGAAAAARPSAARTEHFQEVTASPTSNKANVIAYGAFTAAGIDTEHANNTDTFTFPGGSFLATLTYTGQTQHLNKATCLVTQTVGVTYKISHGTGKYSGISGSGHATISDLQIAARNSRGACSLAKTPLAQQVIAYGQGPVTLP